MILGIVSTHKLKKDGWIQTDASCNQYYKPISSSTYLFREDRIINPITKEVELYEVEINLNDYSNKQIVDICDGFGYNEKDVIDWKETKQLYVLQILQLLTIGLIKGIIPNQIKSMLVKVRLRRLIN